MIRKASYFCSFIISFKLLFAAGLEIEIDKNNVEKSLERPKNQFKGEKDETDRKKEATPKRSQTLILGEKHIAPEFEQTPKFADTYYYKFNSKRYSHPGNLIAFENGYFFFKPYISKNKVELDVKQLEGIKFHRYKNTITGSGSNITLTNGDSLYGNIIKIDNDYLYLNTWYAGDIQIPRPMIFTLETQKQYILNGFYQVKDLLKSRGANWHVKPDNFSGRGAIGKALDLPKKSTISFKLSGKNMVPTFRVGLFATSIIDSSCMQLAFRSGYINFADRDTRTYQTVRNIPNLTNATIKITIDKSKKNLKLYINNRLILDKGNLTFRSGKKVFYLDSYSSNLEISNLMIRNEIQNFDFEDIERAKDKIILVNGESIDGISGEMLDENIALKSTAGEMKVPIKNIHSILYNTENAERARRERKDVILYFSSGGKITLSLDQIKDNFIYGMSENFTTAEGKKASIKIDIRAIKGIRLNPYSTNQEALSFEN